MTGEREGEMEERRKEIREGTKRGGVNVVRKEGRKDARKQRK